MNELGSAELTAGAFDQARAIDVAPGDPLIAKMQELDARVQRPADRILLTFGLVGAREDARAGIYQGSTGKWRGFDPYLKPLIDHFSAG